MVYEIFNISNHLELRQHSAERLQAQHNCKTNRAQGNPLVCGEKWAIVRGGDSVVTSIQVRPLSEGGEISFGLTDNEERKLDMNEIPELRWV